MKTKRFELARVAVAPVRMGIAVASLALFAWPISSAMAQPTSGVSAAQASDQADALLKEGIALANDSKWPAAKAKLAQAFQLKKSYDIAGNLAMVEDQLGEHAAAANHLDFAIRTFPASGKPEHRQTLRDQMAKVAKTVGSIRFDLREPGCSVKIDGEPVESDALRTGVYVAPGLRDVVVTKEGFKDFNSQENVTADAYVVVTVRMDKKAESAPGGSGRVVPAVHEERPLWVGWLVGGVGVASAAVGAALVGVGQVKLGDAKDLALTINEAGGSCEPATGTGSELCGEGPDGLSTAGTLTTSGAVLLGVGAALIATGVIYLVWPDSEPQTAVIPWADPSGGGLLIRGTF